MIFKAEDFKKVWVTVHGITLGSQAAEECAEVANAKLNEWLSDTKTVYGGVRGGDSWWGTDPSDYEGDTHQAKLVMIKKNGKLWPWQEESFTTENPPRKK